MHVAVYLPLFASLLAGCVMPAISRLLPPAQATWALTVGAVILALSTAVSLGLLAVTVLGQQPELAALGHWTGPVLRERDPVATPIAAAALAAIPVLTLLFARSLLRSVRSIADAFRTASSTPRVGLVITDQPELAAFAVPGWPGRIVISRSLLEMLRPAQRRSIIAHESSHLRHHHYVHLALISAAAAVNPLLRRLVPAADLASERWADEDAARDVGDRRLVAETLATTALRAGARRSSPAYALAAAEGQLPARVAALLDKPVRSRPYTLLIVTAIVTASGLGAAIATRDLHQLLELIQTRPRGR